VQEDEHECQCADIWPARPDVMVNRHRDLKLTQQCAHSRPGPTSYLTTDPASPLGPTRSPDGDHPRRARHWAMCS
jgi:hypothetical protein